MRDEQTAGQKGKKRRPGRPRIMEMPPPIRDTPENILKTVLAGLPKQNWRYLEEHDKAKIPLTARTKKSWQETA